MNYPILLYRGEQFNANFYYFAKLDIDHAFLLIDKDTRTLFVPKLNESLAREQFDGKVIVYENAIETLKKELKGRVFVDGAAISMRLFEKLSKFCKPIDASEKFAAQRAVKNKEEISKIARAAKITKEIFNSIDFSKMRTELDVKRFLLRETLDLDVEPAFEPIVATDRNASFPHYRASNVKLGNMVLIDYAVKYQYYCADLTRCFFLKNSEENKELEGNYNSLIEITNKIVANLRRFKTGKDVALYSEKLIKEYKFPPMIHSIGHGVGLEVHEAPRLGKKSKDKLANAALAIEPAVYFKEYGLRYEETIYISKNEVKIL
ncbi:aminopeptidase P family protein [Candidatus Micrarchaeota archaeon]|nr:aminopeptidase P family protein [Candidatus Micrarchaeota archaeon]